MMASARWGLRFARLAPGLAAWVGAFALRSLTAPDVRLFPDSALADFPESDRTVLKRPEIRNALSEAVREGFRQGARGPSGMAVCMRNHGHFRRGIFKFRRRFGTAKRTRSSPCKWADYTPVPFRIVNPSFILMKAISRYRSTG